VYQTRLHLSRTEAFQLADELGISLSILDPQKDLYDFIENNDMMLCIDLLFGYFYVVNICRVQPNVQK